ncbi:gamma-glutamyl hydrolase [Brevibacillus sp. SYP-B805]|uniref:C40 family peptidase n=1 Tax=Brevibacillus sp. SYP-B805 TaxID=1578199 RepID=UPI0013ECA2C0|nr:C40 family peptidase [Brevibacillus sp. SYP-B805]NGQ94216.1 gamma-glutamyl hydrolase [Brevibacillus sp. SYP-B805]
MTKRDWLQKSSVAVLLSTSLLMFTDGGQAAAAAANSQLSAKSEQVVKLAYDLVGEDYQYGAEGPDAFGSAGFVAYIYGQAGFDLQNSLSSLYQVGDKVDSSNLLPGDLVFFSSNGSHTPQYVGIYVGDDTFVYASQSADEVIKVPFSKRSGDFIGARRLLKEPAASVGNSPTPDKQSPAPSATIGDKVIAAGLKYLGTPYKFGDSRSDKRYMDCSDFTYNAYKDIGIKIPTNSRSQKEFVEKYGAPVYQVKDLQKGDLIFMMSYKGSKKSDYQGIDKSKQRITHVGIYLGDGRILHTYSKESGGVKITKFTDTSWEYRFVMGGRPY